MSKREIDRTLRALQRRGLVVECDGKWYATAKLDSEIVPLPARVERSTSTPAWSAARRSRRLAS